MDIGYGDMNWIELAHSGFVLWILMNTIMDLRVV
jgi:hypothetical protein